ncbi:hypothetical protein [Algoriphagus namhaensis]
MFCLIENSLPFLRRFTKRQRLLFRILLLSAFWAIAGAYLKISGHEFADWLLGLSILGQILSVIGLVSKWSRYRVISE